MRLPGIAVSVAFSLTLLTPTLGRGATIDFEDVAIPSGTFGGDVTLVSGGFLFEKVISDGGPEIDFISLANDVVGANNDSTYLLMENHGRDATLTMTQLGGGSFSLHSLDLAEMGFLLGDAAGSVRVTGIGATTSTMDIELDFIFDGPGPLSDFQTVLFGAEWANLTSLIFRGGPGSASCDDCLFGLDNIEVDITPVPEPASLTLLGVGLASLGVRRWRRRADR